MSAPSTRTSSPSARRTLLTAPEVADLLRVTPRTVWRWAAAGRLQRVRIGGITRYPAAAVEELLRPDDDGAAVTAPPKGAPGAIDTETTPIVQA